MAPPRKVSRGTGEIENDPERDNRTQARASNVLIESDPERANKTQARAPAPAADPEVDNATQARAPNPLRRSQVDDDPERANKTQARAAPPPRRKKPDAAAAGEDDADYRTGQSYQPAEDEEEGLAGNVSLDGDGLEALDPEVGSSTKALPALQVDDAGGSDDDEGADDANATRAGPPIKFEIVAGPDQGKKKKFKGVRMVIGRTQGVDFLLSDQSVSRRHVELIQGDDGVLLRDLGSGNGTKVNGTKVAEKKLEHGDEISIGKTKIRFVDEVAAFKKVRDEAEKKEAAAKAAAEKKKEGGATEGPGATTAAEGEGEGEAPAEGDAKAEAKGADKKPRARPVRGARQAAGADGGFAAKFKALPKPVRLGILGGVGVVLLIFIIGIALRPPPPPPVDPSKVLADAKMQEARNLAKEGDYARVVELVGEAEALVPGIDKTKLAAQAKGELAFLEKLAEARAAIAANKFDDARKALDGTGKGALKTEEEKVKVRAELEAAELVYKKAKIDELIAAGEIDAARAAVSELPVEMQGEPAQKIAEFERELEEQNAADEKDAARSAAIAAANRKAKREQEINEAFTVVERKFGGGEWDRAASECARVMDVYANDKDIYGKARKLQGLIPSFGRNFDEGMKKFRQGNVAQAAKPLRAAHQTYLQLGLKANKWGQELQDRLGTAAIAAGKEALLRNDLVTAWQMFKDAAKFDPGDSKARSGLEDVAAKAEDLFQEGYVVRDRDPREAVRKFKVVVQVTDPGTSVHEKAKNQLAAMAP